MADSFGLKLGIEGERKFKSSLKDINATMKVLGSEMTLVASKFDKQDKSVQALNARNSVLNAAINEQRNKIDLLQKALANATLSFGEADSRTKAWQEKLNKAQAELNGMERELDQNNKALKNVGEEYDDAGKECKKFGEEVKDSGEKAEKSGHKLETLGKIAKGLGVAFTAAFAAMVVAVKKVVGVIGDCVDVYADFDDSMRQVAATMGMSADEIGQAGGDFERLAQAAKDAGASTRYTASDAADALNYLALAGYDTNKAIETMPKVLTLAAAGGMDLAYASDMVTDSMSALNIRDFGGVLIDTVKSVFGIASPSKVFADEIGKNLGLGVGVGFEDAMRDVSKDMADAIPTDFDVAANVRGTPEIMPASGGGITLTLNIENFHNYRAEDINELADELSVILASKMNRKAAF